MLLLVEEGRCKEVGGGRAGGSHCPQKGLRDDKLLGRATVPCFKSRLSRCPASTWKVGQMETVAL